ICCKSIDKAFQMDGLRQLNLDIHAEPNIRYAEQACIVIAIDRLAKRTNPRFVLRDDFTLMSVVHSVLYINLERSLREQRSIGEPFVMAERLQQFLRENGRSESEARENDF